MIRFCLKRIVRQVLFRILLITGITLYGGFALGQQRIGHVNSNGLIQSIPEFKSAIANMEAFHKEKQSELQAQVEQVQKLEKLGEELFRNRSEANKDSIDARLRELDMNYRQARQELEENETHAEQDLVKRQAELFSPLMERVNEAIKLVAGEEGYGYIFDLDSQTPTILYHLGGDNLNEAVKTRLVDLVTR